MRKRILGIALALSLLFSFYPVPVSALEAESETDGNEFPANVTQSEEEFQEEAASELPDGVIVGDPITRAEWTHDLVMVCQLTLVKEDYPDLYYPDLTEETAYYEDIMVAVKYGLIPLEAGEDFRPEDSLTREFAVQTLNSCLGIQCDAGDYTYSDSDLLSCPDDAQVALNVGWLAPVDGAFSPEEVVTGEEQSTMLRDAQSILESRKIDSSASNYTLADNVIVIPQSVEFADDGAGVVTLTDYSGTIQPGDIFAYDVQGIPYIYQAADVTADGNTMRVVTEEAPQDALLSCDISGSLAPDILDVEPDTQTQVFLLANGDTATFKAAKDGFDYGKTNGRWWISYEKTITLGSGATGKLSVRVDNIDLTYAYKLNHKYLKVDGDVRYTSSIQLDFLDDSAAHLTLGKASIGIDKVCGGSISLELDLKMEVSVDYTYNASFSSGVEWTPRYGYALVSDFSNANSTIAADGTVSALLSVTAAFQIGSSSYTLFYAKATASVGPVIKLSLIRYSSGTPETCITISGYISAQCGVYAEIILQQPFSKTRVIWDAQNSPVKVWEHVEDGVTVNHCSRGEESGVSLKYITPSNSRYYISVNPNASSSGTGSGGQAIVIWETEVNEDGTVTVTGWSGGASILNIPETIDGAEVTAIGKEAFQGNLNLRMVRMPDTVTEIAEAAFSGCSNLETVDFSANLTAIGRRAFADCTALKMVQLPEGLLYIDGDAGYQGGGTFCGCTSLEEVYIPSTLEECGYYYGGIFEGCEQLDRVIFGDGIPRIPEYLFYKCLGLTHIEIPDSVIAIGQSAFSHSGLATITIPDTIVEYESGILQNCADLVSAKLSENALSIPGQMFSGCTSLESIELPYGVTQIQDSTFYNCTALKEISLPDTVTAIGQSAFYGCGSIENLKWMPETVTSIGSNAFQNCTSLLEADLPDLVSALGSGAFQGCTALTSVKTGNDLLTIQANCFQNCTKLEKIFLNDGLTTIGDYAFQGDKTLIEVTLPDSVTDLGTHTFQGCTALTRVTLSNGLTMIPSYGFANCTALESIVIPKGVVTVDTNAFYQDTKLVEITLPVTVTAINNNAISYPTKMTVYGCAGSYAESWAAEKRCRAFVDITVHMETLSLANGTDHMTIGRYLTVAPQFSCTPSENTDTITLVSSDPNIVSVKNGTALYGNRTGTTSVTATSSGGKTVTFLVTVDTVVGVEIARMPDFTEYGVGEDKDLTGLVVNAVFANGDKERIYDYTVTNFSTDSVGERTILVHYGSQSAQFEISVSTLEGGSLGETIQWSFHKASGTLSVSGEIPTNSYVFVVQYNQEEKLIATDRLEVSGGKIRIAEGASWKLLWLDRSFCPLAGAVLYRA